MNKRWRNTSRKDFLRAISVRYNLSWNTLRLPRAPPPGRPHPHWLTMGEATVGTYIAYGVIVLFLLVVVAMFIRFAAMVSLLLLSPAAAVLRRLRGRTLVSHQPRPEDAPRRERHS